jgi:N-acetylglucosamine kinase-like BadF-type ATPase
MRCVLGFDGGGTKTESLLLDEHGSVLASGRGGPSNPVRVGFDDAIAAIRKAAESAMLGAGVDRPALAAICAGIAGTGDAATAERMRRMLASLYPGVAIKICTDLEIALAAAGAGPAVVLIAGTGSAAIGRNATNQVRRAGGLGARIGDEGSATDVGRKAVIAAKLHRERSGEESPLGKQMLRQVGLATWNALSEQASSSSWPAGKRGTNSEPAGAGNTRQENYEEVYPRLFPVVTNAADAGDEMSRGLLRDAAESLAGLVKGLVEELGLQSVPFHLAKTGGMIGRCSFFETELDARLREAAPGATLGELPMVPAHAASLMALELLTALD